MNVCHCASSNAKTSEWVHKDRGHALFAPHVNVLAIRPNEGLGTALLTIRASHRVSDLTQHSEALMMSREDSLIRAEKVTGDTGVARATSNVRLARYDGIVAVRLGVRLTVKTVIPTGTDHVKHQSAKTHSETCEPQSQRHHEWGMVRYSR